MSEDRLHDARVKAARAEALLNDETLTEAFDKLKTTYIDAWQATTPHDEKGREKLYLAVNLLGKIRQNLATMVSNGRIADAELKELIAAEERRKASRSST